MRNHAIKKLINFYDLSQFEKNAEQDLFSVYFYETDTAILCHSGLFFDASTKKASKEQYLQNLSKAFKILPIKTANIFKEYLDLTALHNCKPTYGKEVEFEIFHQQEYHQQKALLSASINEDKVISIEGIFAPIPEPLNFNSLGAYIPCENPTDESNIEF